MHEIDIPVQIPLTLIKQSSRPLQDQICMQLRTMVRDGRLRPGTRLTSIRELAAQLDVSFNTVKYAYQQLISEGYLTTSKAKGTFVAKALPDPPRPAFLPQLEPKKSTVRHAVRFPPRFQGRGMIMVRNRPAPEAIDFWAGRTDPRMFPVKDWRHLTNLRLQDGDANLTDYGDAAGLLALRRAVAEHLARARSFQPHPSQIVITSGIQEALSISARLFLAPGVRAATEGPCYKGASYAFQAMGAAIVRGPVDEEGIRVDHLPRTDVALVYVTPSHQYPLGHILSMKRRRDLLAWASESGAYIIEDDYDSDFRFEDSPMPALASLDRIGSVIYLGTFSKVMGAGLRLGYMVLPEELVDLAATVKSLFSFSHPWLEQAVMADFIGTGEYAKRLRQMRHDRMTRRDCLREALRSYFGEVTLAGLSGGMHVVWHLPEDFPTSTALQAAGAELGVHVYSPDAGGADMTDNEALNERLLFFGYASLSCTEIREGIRRLAVAREGLTDVHRK